MPQLRIACLSCDDQMLLARWNFKMCDASAGHCHAANLRWQRHWQPASQWNELSKEFCNFSLKLSAQKFQVEKKFILPVEPCSRHTMRSRSELWCRAMNSRLRRSTPSWAMKSTAWRSQHTTCITKLIVFRVNNDRLRQYAENPIIPELQVAWDHASAHRWTF